MQFPTTAWTLLRDVQNLPPDQRHEAWNRFLERYWRPVFYFIRAKDAKKYPHECAEDLTQDFLLHVFEKNLVAKADRERGRFRGFLKTNLNWFLANQSRAKRQEIFEQKKVVPLSKLMRDEDRSYEPALNETADSVYDKAWASDLVNRALRCAEQACKDKGHPDWWYTVFAARYGAESPETLSQEKLAEKHGVTRDRVRTAQEHLEQIFGRGRGDPAMESVEDILVDSA